MSQATVTRQRVPAAAPPGRRRRFRRARGAGPATPMDPRFAQRRDEVARHRGRRRTRLLLGAVVLAVLVAVAWVLLHSSLFSVRHVSVVGSSRTPAAEVVSAAGLTGHPPLIDVGPGPAAARVERLPWVASATVARRWPDTVVVTVRQRRPLAVIERPGPPTGAPAYDVVDRTGRVLAVTAAPPPAILHLGAPGPVGPPGSSLGAAARAGLKVAATLPPAFASQVTAVTAGAAGQVGLTLTRPVTVQLGTAVELSAKYEDVASMLAGASLHDGDVIDVSVPGSPTVISG